MNTDYIFKRNLLYIRFIYMSIYIYESSEEFYEANVSCLTCTHAFIKPQNF